MLRVGRVALARSTSPVRVGDVVRQPQPAHSRRLLDLDRSEPHPAADALVARLVGYVDGPQAGDESALVRVLLPALDGDRAVVGPKLGENRDRVDLVGECHACAVEGAWRERHAHAGEVADGLLAIELAHDAGPFREALVVAGAELQPAVAEVVGGVPVAVAVKRAVQQTLVVPVEQSRDALKVFELVAAGPVGGALVALHLGGRADQAAMFHFRAPCCWLVAHQGSVWGSPKWGSIPRSPKRVIAEIWSPARVRTNTPRAWAMSACGSLT